MVKIVKEKLSSRDEENMLDYIYTSFSYKEKQAVLISDRLRIYRFVDERDRVFYLIEYPIEQRIRLFEDRYSTVDKFFENIEHRFYGVRKRVEDGYIVYEKRVTGEDQSSIREKIKKDKIEFELETPHMEFTISIPIEVTKYEKGSEVAIITLEDFQEALDRTIIWYS